MKKVELIFSPLAMVKMIIVLSFVTISISAMASSQDSVLHVNDTTKKTKIFEDYIQRPQFRGGNAALIKYLNGNIKYPPQAIKDSIQGRVVVKMLIDPQGYVSEVEVVRSVREDLDQEAVRVAKSLPRFSPGREYGKAVSMWYTLPVTFKIDAPDETKVEEPKPEFPGGDLALKQYLNSHGHFSAELLKSRSRGWVEVDILVDAKGRIDAVKVDKSYNESLDCELIRVLQTLPRFIPCRENGVPVSKWVKFKVFYSRNPELPIMHVRSKSSNS
ncbi:MAG: TonB family protein [Muribaculaceae bacterium]|nr:TonB family protein [Muribaculaceae bacterium]